MNKESTLQLAQILKDFDSDEDLAQLEIILDRFNVFEALGVVRHELRHSDFLAYLLDPGESHKLKDTFAKCLLQMCLTVSPADHYIHRLNLGDPAHWDFGQAEVLREWANIDILFADKANRLVIIIENKIDTVEHSDQLKKYLRIIRRHPGYRDWRIVGLYLTPQRATPTDPYYLALGYSQLCDVLDSISEDQSAKNNLDLSVALRQYTQTVRRHIVGDPEIIKLAQQIHRKHKRALDMIYQYRPDHRAEIYELLVHLIGQKPYLALDESDQSFIRFGLRELEVPQLLMGYDWTSSHRILLFVLVNGRDNVSIELDIGPGDEGIRRKLKTLAKDNKAVFNVHIHRTVPPKWTRIYQKQLLGKEDYVANDMPALEVKLTERWTEFVVGDLERIRKLNWRSILD
ncbi:MAG: PD-(D/E)XK nuclease family protein [Chloroflexia bacterium]